MGLILRIFEKGFNKEIDHLSHFEFSQFHNYLFRKGFDGSSQLALLQEKRRFRQANRKEVDSGTRGDLSSKGFQGVSGFQTKS